MKIKDEDEDEEHGADFGLSVVLGASEAGEGGKRFLACAGMTSKGGRAGDCMPHGKGAIRMKIKMRMTRGRVGPLVPGVEFGGGQGIGLEVRTNDFGGLKLRRYAANVCRRYRRIRRAGSEAWTAWAGRPCHTVGF